MTAAEIIDGSATDLLLLCDHASAAIPAGIDLGIDPALLGKHIAVDIGAAALTRTLAARLDAPAILGTVSRLVIDLHREPDHRALIPLESDGHAIPGNRGADRAARIAAFHAPYHARIAAHVRAHRPRLILAVHSFTPRLETDDGPVRPWEIGILYNRDVRAAAPALASLRGQGVVTGDNAPYSGRLVNTTLNRHAEAKGIPSCAIEVRNDLIGDAAGVDQWAQLLENLIGDLRNGLAQDSASAT